MSPGSRMQIRYTHKLSMHKADFLKIGKFARRFECRFKIPFRITIIKSIYTG